jgi:hypothetical protein
VADPEQVSPTPAFRRGPRRLAVERGRRYDVDGDLLWSVTSILKAYPAPGIVSWGMRTVAEKVVEHWNVVKALHDSGDDVGLIDYLKGAPWRERDRRGDLGSRVHDAAEAHVLGRPHPPWTPEEAPFMRSLEAFLRDHRPEYLAAEATVVNRTENYAGTLDAVVLLEGEPWLIDYKTAEKGPFETDALQLAAYRHAEEIYRLPDGSSEPMIDTAGGAILKLRPDGYTLHPCRTDDEVYRTFLYVREVFRFTLTLGDSRSADYVVGQYVPSDAVLHRQLAASIEGAS